MDWDLGFLGFGFWFLGFGFWFLGLRFGFEKYFVILLDKKICES